MLCDIPTAPPATERPHVKLWRMIVILRDYCKQKFRDRRDLATIPKELFENVGAMCILVFSSFELIPKSSSLKIEKEIFRISILPLPSSLPTRGERRSVWRTFSTVNVKIHTGVRRERNTAFSTFHVGEFSTRVLCDLSRTNAAVCKRGRGHS